MPNVREYADPRVLLDLGLRAERANWDGFFVWDHLAYSDPEAPVADPWMTIAAVAASTERVRLGVMVCILARRRPQKVARETASLHLSPAGGSAGAGLGSQWEQEFAAFGEDPDPRVRAARLDEGSTSFPVSGAASRSATADPTTRSPRRPPPDAAPAPSIPVWIAGRWPAPRPFRRAARWDGVFAIHREVSQAQTMTPSSSVRSSYTLAHSLTRRSTS